MPAPETITQIALVFYAALVTIMLAASGALSARAFAQAPGRKVGLGLMPLMVGMMLMFAGAMAFGLVRPYLSPSGELAPRDHARLALIAQLLTQAPVAFFFVALARRHPDGLARVGLLPRPTPTLGWAVAGVATLIPMTLATLVVSAAVATAAGYPPEPMAHELLRMLQSDAADATVWAVVAISAVALAPFFEEVIFRGLMQSSIVEATGGGRWLAIGITSILFAYIHVGGVDFVALPGLLVLGVGLGWLYERSGSLWVPILVHASFNAFNLVLAFAAAGEAATQAPVPV